MTISDNSIDGLLSSVLRGDATAWPAAWSHELMSGRVVERISYHGIAGLIADRAQGLPDWPAEVLAPVRQQGIALAMWEMRHKAVLGPLLAALAEERILALLLKGTALAYDLYPNPATRARGDTDLLIGAADLQLARSILTRSGFRRQSDKQAHADVFALQEVWSLTWEGETQHHIDLHWQLLNAPALRGVLNFFDCATQPIALPQLSADALAMSRVLTLVHTCIHRAMHITSPYFVDGVTYYGGDRLIWAKDIHLLGSALSEAEWEHFYALSTAQGVATVCLNGLKTAQAALGTEIPDEVVHRLSAAEWEPASAYLLDSRQLGRAWKDFAATRGWRRKLAYVGSRTLPSAAFIRGKYPSMAYSPLGLLYIRRVVDLIRTRRGRIDG